MLTHVARPDLRPEGWPQYRRSETQVDLGEVEAMNRGSA